MRLEGRTLYVVQNGARTIVRLRLSADLTSAAISGRLTDPNLMYPTTLARRGGQLLVVDSQLDRRMAALPPILPFLVTAVDANAFER